MSADPTNVPRHELAWLIAHSGHLAHRAAMIGNPPPSTRLIFERMRNPQVGDLVLETSTYYREPWDPGALGYLDRVGLEPICSEEEWDEEEEGPYASCPTEKVWYVRPFVPTIDGKTEVRWHNADFIALPDCARWLPW